MALLRLAAPSPPPGAVLPHQGARSAPFSHTFGLFWGICRLNVRSCDSLLCALYVCALYVLPRALQGPNGVVFGFCPRPFVFFVCSCLAVKERGAAAAAIDAEVFAGGVVPPPTIHTQIQRMGGM
jgi:hypothetical protein